MIYPLFRANRVGPYTRFINFSHAVRQEQSLPRILSATRYKGLAPGQQREQIFHRQPRESQGGPRFFIEYMSHEDSHDLDENTCYDENGRIHCVSTKDGQAFHEEEWASRDGFDLRLLSRTTIETTKRPKS